MAGRCLAGHEGKITSLPHSPSPAAAKNARAGEADAFFAGDFERGAAPGAVAIGTDVASTFVADTVEIASGVFSQMGKRNSAILP